MAADPVGIESWIDAVTRRIGGSQAWIREIIKTIALVNAKRQTKPPRGVLLHGRPGVGKTATALAIAQSGPFPYFIVNGSDIYQTEEGASESRLLEILEEARNAGPVSIVVMDEIELLAGRLKDKKDDLDVRIASVLLSFLERDDHRVFIIGVTSRFHAIDPCFLRSGRLDMVYEIQIKTPQQRLEILEILAQHLPLDSQQDILKRVASVTHGFVPSDLQSLCTQVVLQRIRQDKTATPVQWQDFQDALKTVRPSGMSEYASKVPDVQFSDLYGMDTIIQDITVSVIHPFHNPEEYKMLGITPPRGIMVHGPPGVGKTRLCCALASAAGVNFMFVESSQIRSKVLGESERNIAKVFAQARANAPCILFIDQIDMLLSKRGDRSTSENTSDRIVTSFLTAMDGLFNKSNPETAHIDVMVLGATNRIHVIDPAILRPGRFDEHIYIPLPDDQQRRAIIQGLCKKMRVVISPSYQDQLVTDTKGWSGAEIENLFREAAMVCLRESLDNQQITTDHLEVAKSTCR